MIQEQLEEVDAYVQKTPQTSKESRCILTTTVNKTTTNC